MRSRRSRGLAEAISAYSASTQPFSLDRACTGGNIGGILAWGFSAGRQGGGAGLRTAALLISLSRGPLGDPEKHTHITIRGHGIMAYC